MNHRISWRLLGALLWPLRILSLFLARIKAPRQRINGVVVLDFRRLDTGRDHTAALRAALEIVADVSPVYLRRAQAVKRILIAGDGAAFAFVTSPAICTIGGDYAEEKSVLEIAAGLIHEGTHAVLFKKGFGYDESIRNRIENVCIRAERRFARKAGQPGLSQAIDRRMEIRSWRSDAELFIATEARYRQDGVPEWLLTLRRQLLRPTPGQGGRTE